MGCNDVIQCMWFLISYGCILGIDDISQWVMRTCTLVLRVLAFLLLLVCFLLTMVQLLQHVPFWVCLLLMVLGLLLLVVLLCRCLLLRGYWVMLLVVVVLLCFRHRGGGGGGGQPRPPMRWTSATSGIVLRHMCELVGTGVRTHKGFKEVHVNKVAEALQEFTGEHVTGTQVYNHLRKW
jgi:hypothetical protein